MQRGNGQQRATARERGYTAAWDRARAGFLRLHPRCAECAREGLIVRATVVDHVIPHRGDQRLFRDSSNWQALCTNHHSSWKHQREKSGFSTRINASGLPVDREHPFYAGAPEEPFDLERRQRPPQGPQRPSGQTGGGSKVKDRRGVGPSGDLPAELVSGTGPEDTLGGAAARPLPSCDRASGSDAHCSPSIAASPSSITGPRHG